MGCSRIVPVGFLVDSFVQIVEVSFDTWGLQEQLRDG